MYLLYSAALLEFQGPSRQLSANLGSPAVAETAGGGWTHDATSSNLLSAEKLPAPPDTTDKHLVFVANPLARSLKFGCILGGILEPHSLRRYHPLAEPNRPRLVVARPCLPPVLIVCSRGRRRYSCSAAAQPSSSHEPLRPASCDTVCSRNALLDSCSSDMTRTRTNACEMRGHWCQTQWPVSSPRRAAAATRG